MFFRHHTDKLIYPIILVMLLVFISYRPKYRLRTEMPSLFFTGAGLGKNDSQRKVATAYWQSALSDVQWKYPHGHPLPVDPPEEFRVADKAIVALAADVSVRSLYWRRLQEVWTSPDAWSENYEWDWSWASDPFSSASEWIKDVADDWLKIHGPK
jgi:hypothetical protein